MKYRRLRNEELAELEKEFIRFLASQAITGDEWEKIKQEKPEQAEELIGIFSDMVFEQVLKKVEYLELKTTRDIKTFRCDENKMVMIGLMIEGESTLDFTGNLAPQQMLQQLQLSGAQLQMYRGEKAFGEDRLQEIFAWMEKGALISKDGMLYRTLQSLAQ